MTRQDRGLSVTVSYAITLAIATILMSALLMSTGATLETRTDLAIRSELDVVGERFVANLAAADRLVQADAERVVVRASVPRTVAGTGYTIEVNTTGSDVTVDLRTVDPEVTVRVPVGNTTAVDPVTINSGPFQIEMTPGGTLAVSEP